MAEVAHDPTDIVTLVRQAKAVAWQEGWDAGYDDALEDAERYTAGDGTPNPYLRPEAH